MSQPNADFALGTFSAAGSPSFPGLVIDGKVLALRALAALGPEAAALSRSQTVLDVLESWETNLPALRRAAALLHSSQAPAAMAEVMTPLERLRVHAPMQPRQIFCAAANYRKHVIELLVDQPMPGMQGKSAEERHAHAVEMMEARVASGEPFVFSKPSSAVTGPYDPIPIPPSTQRADWELELAAVIGRPARYVKREEALGCVAGYTIANDITNRDLVYRKDGGALGPDWLVGKGMPGYCPIGPWLAPAACVGNPQDLRITLKLNGQIMQDESTSDMLFGVAQMIEFLSRFIDLWPGDLVLTGSPAGNGTHYNRFLRPGDIVEGSITGLGTQRNPCIAEGAGASALTASRAS